MKNTFFRITSIIITYLLALGLIVSCQSQSAGAATPMGVNSTSSGTPEAAPPATSTLELTPDAAQVQAVIIRALLALNTQANRMESTTIPGGGQAQVNVIEFVPPDRKHITSPGDGVEYIVIGQVVYAKTPSSGAWVETQVPASTFMEGQAVTEATLAQAISNAQFVRLDALNGVPMLVYGYESVTTTSGIELHSQTELWVGKADGLPYQMIINGEILSASIDPATGESKLQAGPAQSTTLITFDPAMVIEPPTLPTLDVPGMEGVPILGEERLTPYLTAYEQVTGNQATLALMVFHDTQGQPFAAYVDAATHTPFFITTQNAEGSIVWEAASLEDVAEKSGITVGVLAINSQFERYPDSKGIILQEFNGLVLTGFDLTYVKAGGPDAAYDWWYPDTMLAFAQGGNVDGEPFELFGHALVSASNLPEWLVNGSYTNEELMTTLTDHIAMTLQRYPDIRIWTVLNEAWLKTDTYDYLYRRFSNNGQDPEAGAQYVITLFEAARNARPDAILLYSDLDNEFAGERAEMNHRIVEMLKQRGLIDGLSMHWRVDGANPVAEQDLIAMMQSYGVPIYVTEMTIDLTDVQGTNAERFTRQAEIKQQYIRAAVESDVCKFIFDWGIQDSYNWLEKDRNRPAADPTMYDDALNRKPSYYAELAALMPDN